MRDYGKVFSTFWTSDSTRELSDDAKMLALYLLTGPHSNIIGCFRLPDGYVSEDMGWSIQRVSKVFTELFRKGFATREETTKWVFISKHLKWNPLENPNQITGALKLYDQIPDASSVKPLIAKALRKYTRPDLKGYETLPKPFTNPSGTLSKPETETGTETVAESGAGEREHARARPKPPPPPDKLKFGEHGNFLLTHPCCRCSTPNWPPGPGWPGNTSPWPTSRSAAKSIAGGACPSRARPCRTWSAGTPPS